MRILIVVIIFISLLSCSLNSKKNNAQTYSTPDGEFIIGIDTLNINLKSYVSPTFDKYYSLTHAIKNKNKYYCLFKANKESYKKFLFKISETGIVEKEIKLPRDLTNCFYSDLFVFHDTIYSKPYMNDKSYYLDSEKDIWIETAEPDDVIYEDERYYVTYLDFGEWGSTTWFKDKLSGKEYELASSAKIINKIDKNYYISGGVRVIKVNNPLEMKQCDKEYYYQIIKKKEFSEGTNSLVGAEIIYKDTTYSQWDFEEPKQHFITSFKVDNKLFHLCNDSIKTYVAKLQDNKIIPILDFEKKYSVFNWYFSYRCKIQENTFQLLKFRNEDENTFGFIEINGNKINIRYLSLKNN